MVIDEKTEEAIFRAMKSIVEPRKPISPWLVDTNIDEVLERNRHVATQSDR